MGFGDDCKNYVIAVLKLMYPGDFRAQELKQVAEKAFSIRSFAFSGAKARLILNALWLGWKPCPDTCLARGGSFATSKDGAEARFITILFAALKDVPERFVKDVMELDT